MNTSRGDFIQIEMQQSIKDACQHKRDQIKAAGLPAPTTAPATGCAALVYLDEWLGKQCDRDWEHQNGIKLETTDNPGWWLEIDLDGTSHYDLAAKMRNEVWEIEVTDRKLTAYADQAYLADMLTMVVSILAQHNIRS